MQLIKHTIVLAAFLSTALGTSAFAQEGARIPSKGYAVFSSDGKFTPFEFDRHPVGDQDILIEILYSGICHSDVHHAREDWSKENYPILPGHEIAGRVVQVGRNVTKFKVGDHAGVGCLVNACKTCEECKDHEEQYCKKRVLTYGQPDPFHNNEITRGGYSKNIVLTEDFAIRIPKTADLTKVAPLLCAGITTYSPIKRTGIARGDTVAVAGFGGLGHMAVQYAVKLGAEVTVFDITEDKRQEARDMGATKYVNVRNPAEMEGLENSFRVILSTIPSNYDLASYLKMLKKDGEMVVVGLPPAASNPSINIFGLASASRRKISFSQIGGIRQTQEMLDYSVANDLYPKVEIIPIQKLDEAYEKVLAGAVKFRYVIDMSTLK